MDFQGTIIGDTLLTCDTATVTMARDTSEADSIATVARDTAGAAPSSPPPAAADTIAGEAPDGHVTAHADTIADSDTLAAPYLIDYYYEDEEEEDTMLHIMDYGEGVDLVHVELPQYYKESFFADQEAYLSEAGHNYGVEGEPLPYLVKNDTVITSLLIVCFIIMVTAFSNSRHFLWRQTKSLVSPSGNERSFITETSTEVTSQLFMVVFASIQMAMLQYFYSLHHISTTYILPTQYHLIAIYIAIVLAYFTLKALVYTWVNGVMFSSNKNIQWLKGMLYVTTLEGVALYPIVLLQAYFDKTAQNVAIGVAVVLILVKLLTLYKCYLIFFRETKDSLQIILYFCALEIVPLVALGLAMTLTGNYLKVNF